MRRRPLGLSPYWRLITGPEGLKDHVQRRDWPLVLTACGIPYQLSVFEGRDHLYVPALLTEKAWAELGDFSGERRGGVVRPAHPPLHPRWVPACLFPLMLLLWNGWNRGRIPVPDWFPPVGTWDAVGALDTVRVRIYGEWYRTVTALELHADAGHLMGNVAFGMFFLPFAARLVGAGRAVWLTMLGGAMGNGVCVVLRNSAVTSIGFSTALFACMGLQSGFMACTGWNRKSYMMPLVAGVGLLAMLGADGGNTDYMAHVAGLGCGMALGAFEALRLRRGWPGLGQVAGYVAAALLPFLCWLAVPH
ncbi:MAG: rhomboid family intramembrane serine protease [Desulfovibrio sp.]|jgi:membrane associated rhomboid family serine protease|nr:rhomboid family intramembrane serine protease [Desulfovibrio sp.]